MSKTRQELADEIFICYPNHSPRTADVHDWHGVATEERGGIVAFFGDEKDAEEYRQFLIAKAAN
jgi:hypothetical protein